MYNTKIHILSKPQFNDFMANHQINDDNVESKLKSSAVISINDTAGDWSCSWFLYDHPNVLRLWFDDVETDLQVSPTNRETCRACTPEQARRIFEFIKKNKHRDFLVHCSAGISRSGAIGQFILDYLGGDKEYFEKYNPHIHPNAHISRLLNKLAWNE